MEATKTISKPVVIERKITSNSIADDMASRITGKLVNFPDLFNPKTGQFLTEAELVKKGACIVTVKYSCLQDKTKMVVKNRETKEPNPYLETTLREQEYQMIVNIVWQSYIDSRGEETGYIAQEKRSNGVENYADCRAIGKTTEGFKTLNGVIFRVLKKATYTDLQGRELDFNECEQYRKKPSLQSLESEAKKHGLTVKTDVHYSTTRIDNCFALRAFGFEYKPTDNVKNKQS